MAPVTPEYFPARASDEEYGQVDSNTSANVNPRREKARRLGARTNLTVEGVVKGGSFVLS